MRYLLVRQPDPNLPSPAASNRREVHGFCSFMLTYEDGFAVVYIYEIHLAEPLLGIGLGKHLIGIVEAIGRSVGVDKSMLTVFRSNEKAVKVYEHLRYEVDEYSPQDRVFRDGTVKQSDHLILSKRLKEPQAEEEEEKRVFNGGVHELGVTAEEPSKRRKR